MHKASDSQGLCSVVNMCTKPMIESEYKKRIVSLVKS
jgi:hypothetical protein